MRASSSGSAQKLDDPTRHGRGQAAADRVEDTVDDGCCLHGVVIPKNRADGGGNESLVDPVPRCEGRDGGRPHWASRHRAPGRTVAPRGASGPRQVDREGACNPRATRPIERGTVSVSGSSDRQRLGALRCTCLAHFSARNRLTGVPYPRMGPVRRRRCAQSGAHESWKWGIKTSQ